MLSALLFAFNITMPNLLLMALGVFMQKRQVVNDNFVNTASHIVFNYSLPCLLFFSVLKSEINISEQINLLGTGFLVTFLLYFLAELYAYFFVKDIKDKGVFVQAIFRSNMAIIGLATVVNAYGEMGMSMGAVYMGVITIYTMCYPSFA